MTETPGPAGTPDNADPSMEDILASIRRILNEEESPPVPESAVPEPEAKTPPEDEDDDVLVLDQSMMVAHSEALPEIVAPPPEPEPHPDLPAPQAEMPAPQAEMPTPPAEMPPMDVEPAQLDVVGFPASELVAPETAAAAASSVSGLMRALAVGRATQVYTGGPTLEDVVRAELRPLLKEWLDENLPPLVERLVRTEIERVVGRAVP